MVPPIKYIHTTKIDHINKKNSLLIIEFRDAKTKITLKSNIPRYHYTIKNFGNLVKRHTK